MSEAEFKRRRIHGILSSKSLLETLDRLTLNKAALAVTNGNSLLHEPLVVSSESLTFGVQSTNATLVSVQSHLTVPANDFQSDDAYIPLVIKFNPEKLGTHSVLIELRSLPDDMRVVPIDFKVTEGIISDASVAYLTFNTCVFDPIVQYIPIVSVFLEALDLKMCY